MSKAKKLLFIYMLCASIVGTVVLLRPLGMIVYNATLPAPAPVSLPNGFIFTPDWENPTPVRHITDKEGKEIVPGDVQYIMWFEQYIYGYRKGYGEELYYFVCEYEQNCSNTLTMNDVLFKKMLIEKGLPAFTRWDRKSYWELLKIQS